MNGSDPQRLRDARSKLGNLVSEQVFKTLTGERKLPG
jgi:hypothetical protein